MLREWGLLVTLQSHARFARLLNPPALASALLTKKLYDLGTEMSKVVYPILGNLNQPITSYGKEAVGDATIAAYRWGRKEGYKFSVTLVNDIPGLICAEKCRYENRAINKKKHKAGIPVLVG